MRIRIARSTLSTVNPGEPETIYLLTINVQLLQVDDWRMKQNSTVVIKFKARDIHVHLLTKVAQFRLGNSS